MPLPVKQVTFNSKPHFSTWEDSLDAFVKVKEEQLNASFNSLKTRIEVQTRYLEEKNPKIKSILLRLYNKLK